MFSVHKERAASISGSPNAWSHLATFIEYQHATLINCTLACYLRAKQDIPDVATSHCGFRRWRTTRVPWGHATVALRLPKSLSLSPPTLPPVPKRPDTRPSGPVRGPRHAPGGQERPRAPADLQDPHDRPPRRRREGKKEFGDDYWGTGAYVLMVKFAPSPLAGALPFWKHFGIDKEHACATPACTHPWDQLRENVHEGKRQKFRFHQESAFL